MFAKKTKMTQNDQNAFIPFHSTALHSTDPFHCTPLHCIPLTLETMRRMRQRVNNLQTAVSSPDVSQLIFSLKWRLARRL